MIYVKIEGKYNDVASQEDKDNNIRYDKSGNQ